MTFKNTIKYFKKLVGFKLNKKLKKVISVLEFKSFYFSFS